MKNFLWKFRKDFVLRGSLKWLVNYKNPCMVLNMHQNRGISNCVRSFLNMVMSKVNLIILCFQRKLILTLLLC